METPAIEGSMVDARNDDDVGGSGEHPGNEASDDESDDGLECISGDSRLGATDVFGVTARVVMVADGDLVG